MFLKLQNWKLKEVGSSEEISANVPGDITNDLYRAGKIPDPYFGLNHLKLREVADKDFVYTAKFFVKPDDVGAEQFAKSVFLHFENNFEYRFSDNYFDVEAGDSREILVTRKDGGRIDATKLQVECFGSCKERKEKSAN